MSGRILVVDDVATNRVVLRAKLAEAFYDVLQAEDGETALAVARRDRPDIVLLDAVMPGLDGFAVCARLKADPATRHIPVVMLTAELDSAARLRGLEAGADDFLAKPVADQALFARVRNLLREKTIVDELRLRAQTCRALGLEEDAAPAPVAGRPAAVQIVKADGIPASAAALRRLLTERVDVVDARAALSGRTPSARPDLVLIGMDPGRKAAALDLLSELRARPATRHSAFILIVPDGDIATAAAALDLGANDYVFAGSDPHELAVRVRSQIRRKRYSDRLRASVQDGLRLAVIDPLTGLYNRRYALTHLNRIALRAAETGKIFTLMLLDIDRFKQINDRFGHMAGDAVLAEVAARLRDNLRGEDLLSRHGGEEFMAALPDTGLDAARIAAERLRKTVAATPFRLPGVEVPFPVTLSVGVALGHPGRDEVTTLLREADSALYASKSGGRNLVRFAASAA